MSVMTVRPLRDSDLLYFDLWGTPDVDSFNFFGFRTPHRARAAFASDLLARTRRCETDPRDTKRSLAEFGGSVAGQREGQSNLATTVRMTRSEGADVGIEDRYGVVVIDQPWNRFRFRCRARPDS